MSEAPRETLDQAMHWIEKRRDEGNLSAYYYGFAPTGDTSIDLILAAVAKAGKAFHSTEYWTDDDHGPSCVDLIQEAANRAAAKRASAIRPNETPAEGTDQ